MGLDNSGNFIPIRYLWNYSRISRIYKRILNMKKILTVLSMLLIVSCGSINLDSVQTDGYTLEGHHVMYKGEVVAEMSSVELALDDGKLVTEVTFTLVAPSAPLMFCRSYNFFCVFYS